MYLPGVVPPACSGLAVVPVLGFLDGEDYVPSMRQGFLLEWTVSSDDCPKCEASGVDQVLDRIPLNMSTEMSADQVLDRITDRDVSQLDYEL
ncbi:hypothetical protein ZWY2020_028305 [Hordeum vulgare]|nr:hypothetical protein ZWY2020_028305 [Hordeum vulgare]